MFSPLPFSPIRGTLYTPGELMGGLQEKDPASFARTVDFNCYDYYVKHGGPAPNDPLSSIFEALHDNSITQATLTLLKERPRVAAIMGGHNEARGSDVYKGVAKIAAALVREGFFMASGGGPGAMEATHLGARFYKDPAALERAIKILKDEAPALPKDAANVISPDGQPDPKIVVELHHWIMPAYRLSQEADGESLAVPTWFYGFEPSTPLATHIAKYFQNSIREDGLVTFAAHGIVFAPGGAGTLQEIFQDDTRNFYREKGVPFSPMVFFAKNNFWTDLPAPALISALFTQNKRAQEYQDYVLITQSEDEAVAFLRRKSPPEMAHIERLRSLGLIV